MSIEKEELLTNGLEICENCEWAVEGINNRFLKCLLSGEDKGLVQRCEKFKTKTGSHIPSLY